MDHNNECLRIPGRWLNALVVSIFTAGFIHLQIHVLFNLYLTRHQMCFWLWPFLSPLEYLVNPDPHTHTHEHTHTSTSKPQSIKGVLHSLMHFFAIEREIQRGNTLTHPEPGSLAQDISSNQMGTMLCLCRKTLPNVSQLFTTGLFVYHVVRFESQGGAVKELLTFSS